MQCCGTLHGTSRVQQPWKPTVWTPNSIGLSRISVQGVLHSHKPFSSAPKADHFSRISGARGARDI